MRYANAIFLCVCLIAPGAVAAQTFTGRVVSVHDGDTLTVMHGQTPRRVRLAGIDAPELRQAYGPQARQSLEALCLGEEATVEILPVRRGGETTARVHCSGKDASEVQVEHGMAWVYRPHVSSTSPLHFLQDKAQRGREGLWSDPSPLEPWRWRAARAKARTASR